MIAFAAHYVEQGDGFTVEDLMVVFYDLISLMVYVAKLSKRNANFTLSTFGFIFENPNRSEKLSVDTQLRQY